MHWLFLPEYIDSHPHTLKDQPCFSDPNNIAEPCRKRGHVWWAAADLIFTHCTSTCHFISDMHFNRRNKASGSRNRRKDHLQNTVAVSIQYHRIFSNKLIGHSGYIQRFTGFGFHRCEFLIKVEKEFCNFCNYLQLRKLSHCEKGNN